MPAGRNWRRNRRLKCGCLGYWFPHRKGSGTCRHAPIRQQLRVYAAREGLDLLQLLADHFFDTPGVPATPGEPPPF